MKHTEPEAPPAALTSSSRRLAVFPAKKARAANQFPSPATLAAWQIKLNRDDTAEQDGAVLIARNKRSSQTG